MPYVSKPHDSKEKYCMVNIQIKCLGHRLQFKMALWNKLQKDLISILGGY